MDDPKKPQDEDARLLAELSARERELVDNVMAQHPALTVAEAIEALSDAGM